MKSDCFITCPKAPVLSVRPELLSYHLNFSYKMFVSSSLSLRVLTMYFRIILFIFVLAQSG